MTPPVDDPPVNDPPVDDPPVDDPPVDDPPVDESSDNLDVSSKEGLSMRFSPKISAAISSLLILILAVGIIRWVRPSGVGEEEWDEGWEDYKEEDYSEMGTWAEDYTDLG